MINSLVSMFMVKLSTTRLLGVLLVCGLVSSCSEGLDLGIDGLQWKTDTENCGEYRLNHYKTILSKKNELIKTDEKDLTALLGKPDKETLEKRMSKNLSYCISGCEECDSLSSYTKYIVFEFGSLRRLRTIFVTAEPK